ncbi:MAG: SusC/RagA family TonB-linked outer membrane protein, partial [Gemmatimonadaceae bacterium]
RYTDEVKESETETRVIGSVRLGIKLPMSLNFESSVGGNYTARENNSYFPRTVYEGYGNNGLAIIANPGYQNLVHEDLLRYQSELNPNHRIDAVGGFTYEWDRSSWLRNQVANFPDDALGSNRLQNGLAVSPVNSDLSVNKLASWLGRVNYSLMERYLITGTLRTDGSSRFASNNKWATFSSLGLAWRVKQEGFLKTSKLIDDLKLRFSVGQSGNQAIAPYQSLGTIEGATTVLNEQLVSAASIGRLGNPNLKWETTTQSDLGLDLALFGSRLTLTGDIYNKRTTGLLQSVNLAPNTGYQSATFNSGEVQNKGLELAADLQVLQGSPNSLQWGVSGTFSRNRNKIVDLGATLQQFSNRLGAGGGLEVNPFIQKPGLPIGAIWGYRTDGVFRTAADVTSYMAVQADAKLGDYRYADTNGDGKLTNDDRTMIGDVNPSYTWGVTNRFKFRRFDASALVTASHGNSIINSARLNFLTLNGSNGNIPKTYYENAFNPTSNPDGIYPMIRSDRSSAGRFSDAFIEDGSYVRLKNVQIGFELPDRMVNGVQRARLFVNGVNLLTSTDYTGFDPEVSAFSDVSMRGVDLGSYPQSRSFTVGLSVTF